MSIGKVIRKYRKLKDMTQEEMAGRLGVSAPAVNKWEKEVSFPDITLLAPIARLLDISLDTLLSFREELTAEEIDEILRQLDLKFRELSYAEAFAWGKKRLEQYPDCKRLLLGMAAIFDARRLEQGMGNVIEYDEYICSLYSRVLDCEEEALRTEAAGALIGFYMRKKQYEKVERYLEYLSVQNPERKRWQAQIYAETGRVQDAYKAYEELLFAHYRQANLELQGMYMLALRNDDLERARRYAAKQGEMAKCFEMGAYYEAACGLEIATLEKDADAVLAIMQKMLTSVEDIDNFSKAPLYEHVAFRKVGADFVEKLRQGLLKCFCDEESYGFLKQEKRWQEILKLKDAD